MTSRNDIPVFAHEPLPDPKTCIRLLKILSIVETRQISTHCELTAWPFSDAPKYKAISYTWGAVTPIFPILLNGRRMDVRSNCVHTLQQASQHDDGGYIWVDAICINQSDNDEKSAQVAKMGEIYETAVQVLACVGPHGQDSEFLWEVMHRDHRYLQWLVSAFLAKTARVLDVRISVRQQVRLVAWRKQSESTSTRKYTALDCFLRRPYFGRVWIYQELFLGQDVHVLCSGDSMPISWIWAMCHRTHSSLQ